MIKPGRNKSLNVRFECILKENRREVKEGRPVKHQLGDITLNPTSTLNPTMCFFTCDPTLSSPVFLPERLLSAKSNQDYVLVSNRLLHPLLEVCNGIPLHGKAIITMNLSLKIDDSASFSQLGYQHLVNGNWLVCF